VGTRTKPSLCSWLTPPEEPWLAPAEVHVWRADLILDALRAQALERTLSPEERHCASRFRFEADRMRYTAAHGFLREILARYLGVPPTVLNFIKGKYGKPSLSGPQGRCSLRFNLSHSGNLALFAVAIDREVGVDVESVHRHMDAVEIATRFFSAKEAAALKNLPHDRRDRFFFELWTRKEALLKAFGVGLAALGETTGRHPYIHGWRVKLLQPGLDFAGAVAAEGREWLLKCWTAP
jgi:4'-phosphopantetheinyl transferase